VDSLSHRFTRQRGTPTRCDSDVFEAGAGGNERGAANRKRRSCSASRTPPRWNSPGPASRCRRHRRVESPRERLRVNVTFRARRSSAVVAGARQALLGQPDSSTSCTGSRSSSSCMSVVLVLARASLYQPARPARWRGFRRCKPHPTSAAPTRESPSDAPRSRGSAAPRRAWSRAPRRREPPSAMRRH